MDACCWSWTWKRPWKSLPSDEAKGATTRWIRSNNRETFWHRSADLSDHRPEFGLLSGDDFLSASPGQPGERPLPRDSRRPDASAGHGPADAGGIQAGSPGVE